MTYYTRDGEPMAHMPQLACRALSVDTQAISCWITTPAAKPEEVAAAAVLVPRQAAGQDPEQLALATTGRVSYR